jgi:hypothetical protein
VSECISGDAVIPPRARIQRTFDSEGAAGLAAREYTKGIRAPPTRAWAARRSRDILWKMRRFLVIGRLAFGIGVAASSGLVAASSTASEPAADAAVPGLESVDPGRAALGRPGAYCTPLGCPGRPPSPWSRAAAFGAAAAATGWLARRHAPQAP